MTESGSLSTESTSTFSLDNQSEMIVPDFYVFRPPERSKKQRHEEYGQSLSDSSIKQRQKDFERAKNYLMTTMQAAPCKILVLKQALKVR